MKFIDQNKKVKLIEKHYHLVNHSIEKLLLESSEKNVRKALELVNHLDSYSYMFFPNWYQEKSMEEIESFISDSIRFLRI